ncbi:MAG: diguanylate cyclase [Clostridia bacterium]|nr:diguanylate cyclase [Clostridia bacterium]MDD4375475.1 diguanylate cyclase [Clostridia bacterium]
MSSGYTTDLTEGLEEALRVAEESMYKNKLDRKIEKITKKCGNDIDKLIDYIINENLNKCRIDIEKIVERTKRMELIYAYNSLSSEIDVKELMDEHSTVKTKEYKIDKYSNRIEKFRKEAKNKYKTINEEEVEKYAISKMLSIGNFEGTISNEYFQSMEKKRICENDNYELLSVDISGLKHINDTFGHEEGDLQLQEVMNRLKNILEAEQVRMLSPIVVKAAGNCFVPIDSLNKEQRERLSKKVDRITDDIDEEKRLYVNHNIAIKEDYIKLKKQNLKKKNVDKVEIKENTFDILLSINESILKEKSDNSKITSSEQLKRLIKEQYAAILNNDIINASLNKELITYKELREKVDGRFERIVLRDQEPSKEKLKEEKLHIIDKEKIPDLEK